MRHACRMRTNERQGSKAASPRKESGDESHALQVFSRTLGPLSPVRIGVTFHGSDTTDRHISEIALLCRW
jgi:hypothetical protein